MSDLLALDVAFLLPPDVAARAVALSAALPPAKDDELRLGPNHLPHVTLTQQFVRVDELDAALARVDDVLREQPPLLLRVTGGGKGSHAVWMAIESTPDVIGLHERLMEALRGYERPAGTAAAFVDGDARVRDVLWVTGFRLKSSFAAFAPHVTLGHAEEPTHVEPFDFTATTVAACHLGRFCTCRRMLRSWPLI